MGKPHYVGNVKWLINKLGLLVKTGFEGRMMMKYWAILVVYHWVGSGGEELRSLADWGFFFFK